MHSSPSPFYFQYRFCEVSLAAKKQVVIAPRNRDFRTKLYVQEIYI
jgi:hypothetical protein